MRVLALTRYGEAGPSSRVRLYQFIGPLAERGIEVIVRPLFDDTYIARLYQGRGRGAGNVLSAYNRRLGDLLNPPPHDLLWVEKEALPFMPDTLEAMLTRSRTPLVADYDDAVFHTYDLNRRAPVRALLGRKIDKVMARADAVTAGAPYLIERARQAGAERVEFVPSVVDVRGYLPKIQTGAPVAIGWIGSPSTSTYLAMLQTVLAEQTAAGAAVHLVGAAPGALAPLPVKRIAWTAEGEKPALARFDIGVMPLPDTPWERGKCGYKIIQYMAAGLPVVASAVGANKDILIEGETGFLVDSEAGWRARLSELAADPALRHAMGAAGRKRAQALYSTAFATERLSEIFHSLAAA